MKPAMEKGDVEGLGADFGAPFLSGSLKEIDDDLRWLVMCFRMICLRVAGVISGMSGSLVADESFKKEIQPLLADYCLDCHEEGQNKGQIQLDDLAGFSGAKSHLWTKIYEQVVSGEMPPEDKDQLEPEEKKQLLSWIEAQFEEDVIKNPGTRRRLNRREFSAALQDLTGLPIDFGVGLPEDGKVEGFDTGREGLKDTAETVGQMLEVTRRAVDSLRFLEGDHDQKVTIDFREHEFTDFRKFVDQQFKDRGMFTKSKRLTCREGVGVYLPTEWSGDRGASFLAFPAPADRNATLRIKMRVKAMRPMAGLPQPILWVKIGGKYLDYQSIPDEGKTLEYAVRMEDCLIDDGVVKLMLRSVVEVPYAVKGFENDDRSKPGEVPGGIGTYRPKYDRKKLRQPEEQPVPVTVMESIEFDYHHRAFWPPEAWKIEGIEISDSEESAHKLLEIWMERAWRRPVSKGEITPFLKLFRKYRGEGKSFDDALRPAFQSVLMSGGFRYLSPAGESSEAMVSRVSFMLTGGPPNDNLRQLVERFKKGEQVDLNKEIERILKESDREAFFDPFVTQWLVMDQPLTLAMSHLQKQDFRFGRHLKESMRNETVEYLRILFSENRPARELILSDWTALNDILAVHYGIEGVEGAHFRKVKLKERKEDGRGGGILGHAGIQSMLTWMGDNWVIYRGSWTLHHILDDPPPPAPLEVPELNPSEGKNRGKPFRELLKIHLADERCASCHKDMDPLGFAFQNFDLSGRWRNEEFHHYNRKEIDGKIEWRGSGKSRPVDSVGRLPNGEEFQTYGQFKELVVENYLDDVVRGILKRLTLYGTGRLPNVLDLREFESIMNRHRKSGYRLRDVAVDLMSSPVFVDHIDSGAGRK